MTAERLQASPRPTKPPVALDAAGGPISLAERLSIVERNSAARLLAIAEQPLRPVGDVHVACDRVAMIVGKPAAVPRTVTVAGAGMWRNGEARREQLRARQIRGRCAGPGELVAFEVGYAFDIAVGGAARVLPGAWWNQRRRVWVVSMSRPAAAALVQFAPAYGVGLRADAQAKLDDAQAAARLHGGGWRVR